MPCVSYTTTVIYIYLQWCQDKVTWMIITFTEESSSAFIYILCYPWKWYFPVCIYPQHKGTTLSEFGGYGDLTYNVHLSLVFMAGMLNRTMYVYNIVQLIRLSFLHQEDSVLFQQYTAYQHSGNITEHALQGVQEIPWPAQQYELNIHRIWWLDGWLIQLAHLQLWLYFMKRWTKNWIMYCRMVFTI